MFIRVRIGAMFLAVILVAAICFQRQTLQKARAQPTALQLARGSVSEQSVDSEVVVEIERLRQETRDLPRLRNEVRQLRAQTNALNTLHGEHQRLLGQLARLTNAPPRPPPTPEQGFVLNDTWANVGLATPESCVQTFFWAVRQRDLETLATCLDLKAARKNGLLDETTGQWNTKDLQDLFTWASVPAFRIVETRSSTGDKVEAQIQAAVNGAIIPLPLARSGAHWKLSF